MKRQFGNSFVNPLVVHGVRKVYMQDGYLHSVIWDDRMRGWTVTVMHSVTYKRRNYLFAVRRRRVDELQRWVLCLRSPRTHEWLPILGERPFVGHAEAEARLARLAKDNKWEVAYAYGIEFAPPENK